MCLFYSNTLLVLNKIWCSLWNCVTREQGAEKSNSVDEMMVGRKEKCDICDGGFLHATVNDGIQIY